MLRLPRFVLGFGGLAMVLAGVAGIVLGATNGAYIRTLLPPVAVDAAAVGGATVALSTFVAGLGAVQLLLARAVTISGRWATAAAVIVSGLLAAALVALGVVAATEAAVSGSLALLGLGAVLLVVALVYAAVSVMLARSSV